MTLPKANADISELLTDRTKLIEVLKSSMIPTVAMSTMPITTMNPPTALEFYRRILQNQIGITIALIQILEALSVPYEFTPPGDSGDKDQPQ